ncbi:isochorismatase family protein [Glycomyces sp. NPDC047369]
MNRALIVIDVQESFRQRPNWAATSDIDVADKVARLVDHARGRGDLVVWVLHHEPGTGNVFDPARGFCTYIEGLKPEPGEIEVAKTSHNAFTTTNLQQLLTERGIREVAISGIRTEQCCETTARVASDFGYTVDFVVDATATHPIPHRDSDFDRPIEEILADPLTLQTADVIERTVYALAGRFATISTVDEVTAR